MENQAKSQYHIIESITKTQYLIKITQLLVSVSLCSFLFSPSSLLSFFHHFNFFSTFPFQLFTHTIDKNCMFLLCNGLLVFVGITRSFSANDSNADHHHHDHHEVVDSKYVVVYDEDGSNKSQFSDVEAKDCDEQNICAEQVIEIKYFDDEVEGEEEDNIEKAIVKDDDEEEEIENSQSDLEIEESEKLDAGDEGEEVEGFLIEENLEEEEKIDEEEEDDEENCLLSTEELNKKFDDFIRRMREDLRLEAQRQLIMV